MLSLCVYNNSTKEGVSFELTPSQQSQITMTWRRLTNLNEQLKNQSKIFFIYSTEAPTQELMKSVFDMYAITHLTHQEV